MQTKWEYITTRCKKEGYQQSAKIAKQIDEILQRLYGRKHTKTWQREYQLLDTRNLLHIAEDSSYCIACIEHVEICEDCKFAKVAGDCGDYDSLFRKFLDTLVDEGGDLSDASMC